MYGQKSNLRSKIIINTLRTKSNNSVLRYINNQRPLNLVLSNNFATSLCADFSDNTPPPPSSTTQNV